MKKVNWVILSLFFSSLSLQAKASDMKIKCQNGKVFSDSYMYFSTDGSPLSFELNGNAGVVKLGTDTPEITVYRTNPFQYSTEFKKIQEVTIGRYKLQQPDYLYVEIRFEREPDECSARERFGCNPRSSGWDHFYCPLPK